MMPAVNTETPALCPDELRVFVLRHRIHQQDIADRMGCSQSHISKMLNASETGKHVSDEQLQKLTRIVANILLEREKVTA